MNKVNCPRGDDPCEQIGCDCRKSWPGVLPKTKAHIEKQAERYAKLRMCSPREFLDLWDRNMRGEGSFDELVDKLVGP